MKRLTPKMREMLDAARSVGFATSHLRMFSGAPYWHAGGKRFSDVTGVALVHRGCLVLDPDRKTQHVRTGSRYLVAGEG